MLELLALNHLGVKVIADPERGWVIRIGSRDYSAPDHPDDLFELARTVAGYLNVPEDMIHGGRPGLPPP